MSSNWDKEQQYREEIEPLVDALFRACVKAGIPVAIAAQYNQTEESVAVSVSYDVEHCEPGSVFCWLGAVLEAMGTNQPIPIPAPPPLVGVMVGDDSNFIDLLKSLGAATPEGQAVLAQLGLVND